MQVPVTPATILLRHKDMQSPERRGHRQTEVAGHEDLGVIPHEGHPPLPASLEQLVMSRCAS